MNFSGYTTKMALDLLQQVKFILIILLTIKSQKAKTFLIKKNYRLK